VSVIVAHGGTAGAIAEIAGALAIVVLGLLFWVGNRREPRDEEQTGASSSPEEERQ